MTNANIPDEKMIPIADSGNQGGIRMWPSEDWASRLYDIANFLLIGSLIVGAVSTVLVVWMGNVKEHYLKRDLATAQEHVAGLEKDASDAKAAQQRVEIELAGQKERTANAEKAASDATLALAKFKEPRSLSPEQQDRLIKAVEPFAGQNFALAVFPDPEPLALLRVLDVSLKAAGWKRVPSQIERAGGVKVDVAGVSTATIFDSGVDVYIAPNDTESVPAQMAFCSALRAAAIHCETHRTPQLAGKDPRSITISVGKKP